MKISIALAILFLGVCAFGADLKIPKRHHQSSVFHPPSPLCDPATCATLPLSIGKTPLSGEKDAK